MEIPFWEAILKENKSSRTALAVAFFRAVESTRPESTRVCFDPLARYFLGRPAKLAGRNSHVADLWYVLLTRQGLGPVYGEVVARTRYIDDLLVRRIAEGAEQVVILGAGFDTRAYRFANSASNVRFYELDHPATQERKRNALRKVKLREPSTLTFVPVDFGKDDFTVLLGRAGFRQDRPAFFIWEGVTMYLQESAVDETLSRVASSSQGGTSIVFNYSILMSNVNVLGTDMIRMLKRMRRWGEPIVWGLEWGAVEEFLSARGFEILENRRCVEVGCPYFLAVGREQKISSYIGIVHARVA